MRIVAGKFRGMNLITPKTNAIRPTTDRVRESIFNIIQHKFEANILNARILDCFAGTGALGLEALSRGASYALFVDDGIEARAIIRENIQKLGVAAATKLLNRSVLNMGPCHPFMPFDMVFMDPPYQKSLVQPSIDSIIAGGWVAKNGLIVVEEAIDALIETPIDYEIIDKRIFGETQVCFMCGINT